MKLFKKNYTIIAYLLSAFLSFIIDILVFRIMLFLLNNQVNESILVASYIARAISSIINYLFNKKIVFKYKKAKKDNTWWQYFILVIINVTISGTLVTKIYNIIHKNAVFIKICTDIAIFIINFFIQRLLIFKKRD